MLVLGRQKNESIVMTLEDGREIEVCVVEIRGDKVRLGIEAPGPVVVDRREVYIAKKLEAAR